jgi:2TM domain-containing protein
LEVRYVSVTSAPTHKRTQEATDTTPVAAAPEARRREEAIASLKRKRKFIGNLSGYLVLNGVLWLIWALTDRSTDGGLPWPGYVSIAWGFFLAIEGWRAFVRWPASVYRPIAESDIEHELERIPH